jgi:hypothetical protein
MLIERWEQEGCEKGAIRRGSTETTASSQGEDGGPDT